MARVAARTRDRGTGPAPKAINRADLVTPGRVSPLGLGVPGWGAAPRHHAGRREAQSADAEPDGGDVCRRSGCPAAGTERAGRHSDCRTGRSARWALPPRGLRPAGWCPRIQDANPRRRHADALCQIIVVDDGYAQAAALRIGDLGRPVDNLDPLVAAERRYQFGPPR